MKAPSETFKGIDYVQVTLLPKDQYNHIRESINQRLYIKILIDGKIVSNCLQYKDYEFWYENVYSPDGTIQPAAKTVDKAEPVSL